MDRILEVIRTVLPVIIMLGIGILCRSRKILTREGKPQDKVVALPVKDPYHITRNLLLLVELLYERSNNAKP